MYGYSTLKVLIMMGLRLCLIGFMFGFTLTNRLDFNHTDKVVILYIYIYNLTQKII